jgi:hypothetical protein
MSFLREWLQIVSSRSFVILNWLFFGFMVFGAVFGQSSYSGLAWFAGTDFSGKVSGNVVLMVLEIFVFNLILSGFVVVTLSGFAFFILPVGFLLFRAFLWGMLLNGLSTSLFLSVMPTLIIEGEGYVLACLVGVKLGLSWLRPDLVFKNEELSRVDSLRRVFREGMRIYLFVAFLLFLAAIVEVATISLML